jgi:ribonuclease PH
MRSDKREFDQLRKISVEMDYLEYPAGSCLITSGKTKVLCAVSVENRVPQFLLGQGRGWLTAEYSLLPCSTEDRIQREANTGRLSGRTQEIRRFIGRSLRPIFDLNLVGERTFIIDCDVIQADGGTRTVAVNGAFIALCSAVNKMMANREFNSYPILDFVAAVSVGIINNKLMLDLCYEEDSSAEIDMNLVMTGRGKIIEVQATAEKLPVARSEFDKLMELGARGIKEIIELEKKIVGKSSI